MKKEKDNQDKNSKKSLVCPILIILGVCFLSFVLLYFSREYVPAPWCLNAESIEVVFGLALSISGIVLTFMVFRLQTKSQDIESELHNKRLEAIRKEVYAIKPFNSVEDINKELQEWITKNENSIFIFYFPFSIFPGFWLDGGNSFSQFLKNIENTETTNNKYIFIGPKVGNSLFSEVNEKIVKDKISELGKRLDPKNKETYLEGWKNLKTQCGDSTPHESLNDRYNLRFEELKHLKNNRSSTIEIIELNKTEGLKLPLSSFVLKIANGDNDLFYIDTFDYFSNNARKIIKSIECIERDDFVDELFKILKKPQANTIRDDKIATLFFSSFLEAHCKGAPLDKIKNIIK